MKKFTAYLKKIFTERVRQQIGRIFTIVCVICAAVMSLYMLAMRFVHLENGLTYDELYSAVTAAPYLSFGYVWKQMLMQDVNLPLFNVLLFGWNRLFPFTSYWMHFFCSLTGALAVVLAWVLAPAYWTKLKKAIFVSLAACSFILVAYGSVVRTYSLAVLLAIVFSLLALRIIYQFEQGQNPSRGCWIGFLVAGLLGAYSHYFCAGLFFITALVVFLYGCYYKVGRAWSFWGTAVVFVLWSPWLIHTVLIMSAPAGTWWFHTPFAKATFDIFIFLFGPRKLFTAILYGSVLAGVSLISTHKKELLKRADIVLPVAQMLLLLGVVALVSVKFNLWLDRYFLPMMVSLLLLFAEFLEHLRKRHLALLILWPVFLASWIQFFWTLDYLSWPEYTGLRDLFTRVTQTEKVDKLLVDMEKTGYPPAALPHMFAFYLPKDSQLEMIPLTPETVSLSWETDPKTFILLPLCSHVHLLDASVRTRSEEETLFVFGSDTCLYTARPVRGRGGLRDQKNLFSLQRL